MSSQPPEGTQNLEAALDGILAQARTLEDDIRSGLESLKRIQGTNNRNTTDDTAGDSAGEADKDDSITVTIDRKNKERIISLLGTSDRLLKTFNSAGLDNQAKKLFPLILMLSFNLSVCVDYEFSDGAKSLTSEIAAFGKDG